MPEPKGPSAFVSEAYRVEDQVDLVRFYRKWAEDYDEQMLALGFVAHLQIARLLSEELPDRASAVLDIGCGTGLTCLDLAKTGYVNLDGIDISPDMIRVAEQRGIYRELLVGDVNQPLERAGASYDGAISSGTFTHGHVGPAPIDEVFRILRPGGVLACTVHKDLWQPMGFEATFETLVREERARCSSLRLDKYYEGGEPEGWYCVYQKIG